MSAVGVLQETYQSAYVIQSFSKVNFSEFLSLSAACITTSDTTGMKGLRRLGKMQTVTENREMSVIVPRLKRLYSVDSSDPRYVNSFAMGHIQA